MSNGAITINPEYYFVVKASLVYMYLVNVHSCYPGNPFLLWLAFFAEIL